MALSEIMLFRDKPSGFAEGFSRSGLNQNGCLHVCLSVFLTKQYRNLSGHIIFFRQHPDMSLSLSLSRRLISSRLVSSRLYADCLGVVVYADYLDVVLYADCLGEFCGGCCDCTPHLYFFSSLSFSRGTHNEQTSA